MRIAEENWKVLASLFPLRWQQIAWPSGAIERLRGFPPPDTLLRTLLLHVARGYSLRETVVRVKLAKLDRHFGCCLAQAPAQQRGVVAFVVYRIASGKRRVPARRSYQSDDPDCGWHDRQRARQDGKPMNIAPRLSDRNMLRVRS